MKIFLRLSICFVLLALAAISFAQSRSTFRRKRFTAPPIQVSPPSGVVVQDQFGGQIFGYDIDRNGTEGILSEAFFLRDGNLTIATETFDQRTGKILKVVQEKTETQDDFVTLGILGSHIGLAQTEHVKGFFVDKRTYATLDPLASNKITGKWTPPINNKTEFFEDVEGSQGTPNVAVMASDSNCCTRFVFGSSLAANTFGPKISLTDPSFEGGVPPMLAWNSKSQRAVVAQAEGGIFTIPQIGLVDLVKSKVVEFQGSGFGFVNGLAVDSTTDFACTTTETDNSAEFYNLTKHSGIIVPLPFIGQYSAGLVASDPVHQLFLITHPVPLAPGQIHIYDEKGTLINSLLNIPMGPAGLYLALNPSQRTGFYQIAGKNQSGSALQSFKY